MPANYALVRYPMLGTRVLEYPGKWQWHAGSASARASGRQFVRPGCLSRRTSGGGGEGGRACAPAMR